MAFTMTSCCGREIISVYLTRASTKRFLKNIGQPAPKEQQNGFEEKVETQRIVSSFEFRVASCMTRTCLNSELGTQNPKLETCPMVSGLSRETYLFSFQAFQWLPYHCFLLSFSARVSTAVLPPHGSCPKSLCKLHSAKSANTLRDSLLRVRS